MDTKCKNKLTKKAVSNVQPTFKLQSLNISTADSLLLLLNQTKKRIRKTTLEPPASFWKNISVSTEETKLWKSFKELSDIVQVTCCIGIILFFSFLAVVSPNLLFGLFFCTGILITFNNGMRMFCRLRETDAACKVRLIQADLIKSMNSMAQEKVLAQIERRLQLHSEILREIVDKERSRGETDAVKLKYQEEIASLKETCIQMMSTQLFEDHLGQMFFE